MTKTTDLLDRLDRTLLPQRGRRILCAVSGGLDSMCLLHLLRRWCREQGARVSAAHFNHRLRGAAADRDEAFVRAACRDWDIPLAVGQGDVRGTAEREGLSLEEAARNLRYAFLRRTAEAENCGSICTAHHANDNAETVLLNLIRGAGLRGLTGIPRQQGGIVRPLLDVTRGELEAYAGAWGVPHIHDETNDDPEAAARNLLRLRIMPLLEELNPRAVEHLTGTAARLAREDQALEVLALMEASHTVRLPRGGYAVLTDTLQSWPRASSERMLLHLMEQVAGHRRDFTARHVEAVLALGPGKSLSLPHRLTVRREGNRLSLERAVPLSPERPVRVGETVPFEDWTVTLAAEPGEAGALPLTPPEGVSLAVTHWRGGDRMCLPGRRGERSLKRLCAEAGIPAWERDRLPVLRAGEVPAAVPGVGIQQAFAHRPGGPVVYVTFIQKETGGGRA